MSNDIQPEIRFPGFTEAWEQRKLGEIAQKVSVGIATSSSEYFTDKETGVPFVKNQNVKENWIDDSDLEFITHEFDEANRNKRLKTGDILTVRTGYPGLSAVVPSHLEGAQTFTTLITRLKQETALPEYVSAFINSDAGMKQITGMEAGGAQKNVNAGILQNLLIDLPSLAEQKAISDCTKLFDTTITLQQRKLDLLKETKKGFLQKMFPKNGAKVPEIRFPGFTEDWEERKLGGIGKTYTGLTGKSKEDFGHGDAKFVTYMNVFQNPKATLEQLENVEIDPRQNEVKKGDVFFTTSSETPEEVGMSSVWTHDINNIYLNSFTFAYRPTIKFDLDYLAFMLRSQSVRKKIIYLAQGISRYNISKTKMMDISVPIPVNFEEQQKIGNFFKQLDDTITLHQRKLDLLKETKKGFLQKMFV
ncbi:restriction endonuclease subunit S [Enterococcus faecium]|uniref:restriction endonuclease subunit S n=1 Tax=Enterococcus faecium TaxID=1352 RepID=UPI0023B26CD8|nr:restriction endonuclease subunit S [Enterococcus faecium]